MLLKCGTIAYQTIDMRGLISVAQTPWTSVPDQVTIRPGSAPPQVERVAGEGIENAVEIWDDILLDHRHARIDLRRSDISDLCPCPGDDPSRVCPPAGGEGGWRGDQTCCYNAGRSALCSLMELGKCFLL